MPAETFTVTREGYIPVTGGEVWFQIVGQNSLKPPLLTRHGGPGGSFELMQSKLAPLAEERQVIFYNQLGSEHTKPNNPNDQGLWHEDRFVKEAVEVRDALGLRDYHSLGHSWGGYVDVRMAVEHPEGLLSDILSSPLISVPRWIADAERLKRTLPEEVQATINEHEAHGTTDSDAYREATKQFYDWYFCRITPRPPEVSASLKRTNTFVYNTMWGPSEFNCSGNLNGQDLSPVLGEINVPVLLLGGRYDEATPESNAYYKVLIEQGGGEAEMVVFEESAHLAYVEEGDRYLSVVSEFLSRHDPAPKGLQ